MSPKCYLVVLVLVAALAVTAGCVGSPTPPDVDADIRGIVSDLTENANGTYSFLVTGAGSYDKAWTTTTEDTVILRAEADGYADSGSIADGSRVSVWFTGPVAESYPVQATAGTVLVE